MSCFGLAFVVMVATSLWRQILHYLLRYLLSLYCTWHESTSEVFRAYIKFTASGVEFLTKNIKNPVLVSTLSCLGEAVGLAASLAIASSSDSKVAQASPACSNLASSFSMSCFIRLISHLKIFECFDSQHKSNKNKLIPIATSPSSLNFSTRGLGIKNGWKPSAMLRNVLQCSEMYWNVGEGVLKCSRMLWYVLKCLTCH